MTEVDNLVFTAQNRFNEDLVNNIRTLHTFEVGQFFSVNKLLCAFSASETERVTIAS